VVKRIYANRQESLTDPVRLKDIVQSLFSNREDNLEARRGGILATGQMLKFEVQAVTTDEIKAVGRNIKPGKAPGPDGIPNRAMKLAMSLHSKVLAKAYTQCLREGIFPHHWKLQKLVLIPKPGKPPEEASSYRPICLIDILGKTFECLICARLEAAISNSGGLSPHQYGFRKSRSTIDAIGEVTEMTLHSWLWLNNYARRRQPAASQSELRCNGSVQWVYSWRHIKPRQCL